MIVGPTPNRAASRFAVRAPTSAPTFPMAKTTPIVAGPSPR